MSYPFDDCCPNLPEASTEGVCDDGWCCTHEERHEKVAACLACPPDCRSCTHDETDCECYEHEHPDDKETEAQHA